MIEETLVPPVRIVWPAVADPADHDQVLRQATITLSGDQYADAPPGRLGASVLLDFGVEVFGGIRCDVRTLAGDFSCQVRVRLGESVAEAVEGTYIDREERIQPGSRLNVGVTGFRFARLDLVEPTVQVELTVPTAFNQARNLPLIGSFRSNDSRLDQVWAVGARTVHLCMQDRVWDGIKRGRTVWAGDLYPAAAAIAAVFGAEPVVPASLDHLRDQTENSYGLDWMNGIPAYSLWWVICQVTWYRQSGDRPYLQAQRDYLSKLLVAIDEEVAPDGREELRGWRYLDWASPRDPAAIHSGYQALVRWAIQGAATIAAWLDDAELRAQAEALGRRVASYQAPSTPSKAANALQVLAGMADPLAVNQAILAPDPGAGLTPFLGYAVLEARAAAGDWPGALDLIRSYWGSMIDLGATTFWEDFDLDWVARSASIAAIVGDDERDIHAGLGRNTERGFGLSLCHAWSAGPTAWLSQHVLGVVPVTPGYASVRIEPHLGDLDHASGTVPTPHGPIHVWHERQPDGSITTRSELPAGVTVAGPPN